LGVEGNRQCDCSNKVNSFAAKAIEGLRRFFQLLLVITHLFEGR
jgi:hypothetical protein